MTTKDNDRQGQNEDRRPNAPGAPADLNRTDANRDASRSQSGDDDSKENRGNWDAEGAPTDDRPEGQAHQGERRNEQGQDQRERTGDRPNETGDDRITKRPTDPNKPSASEEQDENEFERED
jgi:hypothetical protein